MSAKGTARQLFHDTAVAQPAGHHAHQVLGPRHRHEHANEEDLLVMLLDVEEGSAGAFHLFGRICDRRSVLIRVQDFAPYFFLPAPAPPSSWSATHAEQQYAWPQDSLERLQTLLNARLPPDCRIEAISWVSMRPIMYYRPSTAGGSGFLRLQLGVGQASVRKAANHVVSVCKEPGALQASGFHFPSLTEYEAEVKPLTRFLCDLSLSGGAWLRVPSRSPSRPTTAGYTVVFPAERVSCCNLEVVASWRSLQSLTPDATQLADPAWQPEAVREQLQQSGQQDLSSLSPGLRAAMAGGILPLRLLTVDVALAPRDGARRAALPAKDPIIAIACQLCTVHFGGSGDAVQEAVGSGAGSKGKARQASKVGTGGRAAGAGTADQPIEIPDFDQDLTDDDHDSIEDGSDDDDSGGGGGERLLVTGAGTAKSKGQQQRTQGGGDDMRRVVFVLAGPAHGDSPQVAGVGGQRGDLPAGGTISVPLGGAGGYAEVVVCGSERELLGKWRDWVLEQDPDALATFQLRDTLGALAARAQAIQLEATGPNTPCASPTMIGRADRRSGPLPAPGLYLSRLTPQHTGPLEMASVVMYTPAWVKSQSRMATTSNQETFKMKHLGGRLVFDVLRQVLTHKSLATFTLADCTQSILNETIEVLSPAHLAQLWAQMQGLDSLPVTTTTTATPPATHTATPATPKTPPSKAARHAPPHTSPPPRPAKKSKTGGVAPAEPPTTPGPMTHRVLLSYGAGATTSASSALAAAMPLKPSIPLASSPLAAATRLARYCFRRTAAIRSLTNVLATVPEAFEMARVTGLSINEVQNKAQMVRTWSLLLRSARRNGYLVGGRQEAVQLIESPLLMHPIEHNTAGLYKKPVACLDFASLYPSLYRAHNLCYTTLVVAKDIQAVGRDNLTVTPAGHAFLKPHIRQGILPNILAALMVARSRTRDVLKTTPQTQAATRAVLDARQKALKLCANALYGFTGAQASPLQCAPLADSCLSLGAASCRAAIQAVGDLHTEGAFGEAGRGARVIYGQTDSLFVLFPSATTAQAVSLGKLAGKLVTERCFKAPMQLQFERVYHPFLLLHVNRYAGKAYETEDQAANNKPVGLLVKGVRSMWRQSAPFVQNVLQTAMDKILMQDDLAGAIAHTEEEIRRLLTGRVELWELIMTGGLWRLTGQQVAAAAAAMDTGGGTGSSGSAAGSSGAGNSSTGAAHSAGAAAAEKVQGPHAALAVKLAHRDPGRPFLLGERIQYVLLSGSRLQDDSAEDPLLAAELGLPPHLELYWKNKLMTPLQEIMEKVLTPAQLQALLTGPHTLVRVEQLSQAAARGNPEAAAAAMAAAGVGAAPGLSDPDTYASGKSKGGSHQSGMTAFFKQAAKCLACKQPVTTTTTTAPASSLRCASTSAASSAAATPSLSPGLCRSCQEVPGRLEEVLLGVTRDLGTQQNQLTATTSACMYCHSGGFDNPIVCANAECNVLYDRLGAARRLAAAGVRQARLDLVTPSDW